MLKPVEYVRGAFTRSPATQRQQAVPFRGSPVTSRGGNVDTVGSVAGKSYLPTFLTSLVGATTRSPAARGLPKRDCEYKLLAGEESESLLSAFSEEAGEEEGEEDHHRDTVLNMIMNLNSNTVSAQREDGE